MRRASERGNIRKMLVCGHVRRERDKGRRMIHMQKRAVPVCARARAWIGGGVGRRPESTKPMLEIIHTPAVAPRARAEKSQHGCRVTCTFRSSFLRAGDSPDD